MSDDHSHICFGIDARNDEDTEFYIKNVNENFIYREKYSDTYNMKFSADGKIVYYVKTDENRRQSEIWMTQVA